MGGPFEDELLTLGQLCLLHLLVLRPLHLVVTPGGPPSSLLVTRVVTWRVTILPGSSRHRLTVVPSVVL